MQIELITTGSELLLGFTLNTHVNYIARQLATRGLRLARHVTISDDPAGMRTVVAEALARADILLITGGLGPTSDDITRDVVAELLGRPLRFDEAVAAVIRERFAKRGRPMPEKILVQAMVPEGGSVLPNLNGTAPGLAIPHSGKLVVLLPGPPREMHPMFEKHVLPLLPQGTQLDCRVLKTASLPESVVEQMVAPVLADLPELELGYCARAGEVEIRLIGAPAAEAERRVRAALGAHIFGTGDERLEEVVVREFTTAGKTVATAESCTGGQIAHRLTNVTGSSAVFLAGWVTYSNAAKMRDLGVREETLRQHGAVSEAVAREMAEGARQRSGADYAVSATGIAGPTGGTAEKPVGLVYIGLATPTGSEVQRHVVGFERETFKWWVSQAALDMVRRALTKNSGAVGPPRPTNGVKSRPVGRAGPSAPPRRQLLSHDVPLGVRADEAVFFITICTQPRGVNQLCQPEKAERLLESVAYRHQRGDWWAHYVLLMPDHFHGLLSFPGNQTLETVIREWKKYAARELGVEWQRDFFEHRLRGGESLRDKQEYIRQNPVRAGLVSRPEDWAFVWEPTETAGGAVRPPRPTNDAKSRPVGRAGPSAP